MIITHVIGYKGAVHKSHPHMKEGEGDLEASDNWVIKGKGGQAKATSLYTY